VVETWSGMIGAWRTKLECSVWSAAVGVGAVPARTVRRCRSPKIRDAVGEFGSGGQDEAFGEQFALGASRWDLHCVDPGAGQDGVERGSELTGSVADEEPKDGDRVV
jgi:hypothetical protein